MSDQIVELSLRLNEWKGRAEKAEARVAELVATLRETGAWPCCGDTPAENFLECRWCWGHTHTAEEKADAVHHDPNCRLVKLGLVSADYAGICPSCPYANGEHDEACPHGGSLWVDDHSIPVIIRATQIGASADGDVHVRIGGSEGAVSVWVPGLAVERDEGGLT